MLIDARDLIYNFDNNDSIIEQHLLNCKRTFNSLGNKKDRLLWTAQVEYFEGLFFLKKELKKDADLHFNECNIILNRLIKECGECSEAYSLLADSHIQIMLQKGLAYQILNGQKIKTLPEKAIKLDPSNVPAYQSLAIYLMNAPEAFGGGIHKAIQILVNLNSQDKSDMFKIYYLLGNAYMKIHDSILATKYLKMALTIYPKNQWAEADLQIVKKQMKNKYN